MISNENRIDLIMMMDFLGFFCKTTELAVDEPLMLLLQ